MSTNEELKKIVRETYGEIAAQTNEKTSCCGPKSSCCDSDEDDFKIFSMDAANNAFRALVNHIPLVIT